MKLEVPLGFFKKYILRLLMYVPDEEKEERQEEAQT